MTARAAEDSRRRRTTICRSEGCRLGMNTYDGIELNDYIMRTRRRDVGRELRDRKAVRHISRIFDEMADRIMDCPFCGGGFEFVREITEYDNGDRRTIQYWLHKPPKYESRDYCILELTGVFTLGAGDARPEDGYIGESAEMWNRRYTGCRDRNGQALYTGDVVTFQDAAADIDGYHDDVFDNRGVVSIDSLGGLVFSNRATVDMDDLYLDEPNVIDCEKIMDAAE